MLFIWIEILKFIKKNAIKFIIGTVVITSIYVGFNYISTYRSVSNLEGGEQEINFRPDAKPANFYFFVSTAEGDAFTNNLLIEQYITLPEVLQKASVETNTNLKEIIEKSDNTAIVPYHDVGPVKVLGLSRDGNTHLNEFYVNIGNEEDNLKIAQYFYDYIITDGLSFLEDKNVYVFRTPEIKDVYEKTSLSTAESSSRTRSSIVKNLIIGAILGGTLTTGVLLLITFISKKLYYSFSYSLRETDYFFLVDEKVDYANELTQLLTSSSQSNQLIVSMYNNEVTKSKFNDVLKNIQNNKITIEHSVADADKLQETDRLIYIIYEGATTREWYNKQRRFDRIYNIPTVVVQVNNN